MAVHYGFDTANYIYNVAHSAKHRWGKGIFYGRYLRPSPGAHNITESSGTHEFHTGWTYGVRHFLPLTEPHQRRLNGTHSDGHSDAASSCSALVNIFHAVDPMLVPSTNRVDVFLAMEAATNLSTAYWNGWAGYVDGFDFAGYGLILYPGLYCNPGHTGRSCSATKETYCFALWPSAHEHCYDCKPFSHGHTWDGEHCKVTGPSTVWQMDEQGVCQHCTGRSWPNVDADRTNGNHNAVGHMMVIAYQP